MRGEVFGRDAELGALDGFLAGLSSGPAALVLAGTAGAGKTTLLQAGLEKATSLGYATLRTAPSHSDMRLAFAGLADLLGPRLDAVLAGLPAPQRHALGVALLIEEAPSVPPEPRVIAAAFRNALLLLAASAPVLLVIDDVQWLDAPTAAAVGFALRRLAGEQIGLLCAQRVGAGPPAGPPLELDRARLDTEVLSLAGLSVGALHHLLRTRLDMSFSHPTLRRIEAESAGNPFIALEIGRALARRGITRLASGPLPVPVTLAGLVGERLQELPAPVLSALEAVAIMPGAPLDRYLAAAAAGDSLDAAVAAGVLDADAGRLRFSHPLLASAVLAAIGPARRRGLHVFAAAGAADPEQRARHQALAADGPSAPIAASLDDAARVAELRGAPATAAELLELAASVTPDADTEAIHRRLLAAGRLLALAGETHAAADVLNGLAARTPPGPRHAEVMAHLGWNSEEDFEASARLLEQALAEAEGAPGLSANIRLFLADNWAIRGDIAKARAEMSHALAHAEQAADPGLLATVLAQAFLFDWMSGGQADEDQLKRALELERGLGSVGLLGPPSMAAGLYLMGVGRLDEARDAFERALARAEAEGVEYTRSDVLLRLSLIASRTGDPRRGAELGQAALEIAEQLDLGQLTSAVLFGCGFAALQLGQQERARALAQRGLELSGRVGDRVYLLCHQALLGSLDLARGDYAAAAARLRPLAGPLAGVGRRANTQGIAPDMIEAQIGAGDLDEAAALLAGLEHRYHDPVTAAAAARCRGMLGAARGDLAGAAAELARALQLGDLITRDPVERGRTLLMLGAVQRRLKQRRSARETLGAAITLFEGAHAALWAARAREELARVSGRAARAGELTATERRVAELIAQGMSNRAAAAELFVTVRTIESTLTKIYAKLGVRSRTQLASVLRDRGNEPQGVDLRVYARARRP
jgi:DNA-binding CsgD family transcriptional regulator/Tfp pilus assembly protein PilF